MNAKIKVRLKRDHYLNGRKKKAGSVVRLNRASAQWLINIGRAVEVGDNQ
jgi:hypothetical protein